MVVELAVHKCVVEPYIFHAVATSTIDDPSSTVPVATFIKHKVEKSSLKNAKMLERFVKFVEAVDEKKTKKEDRIPTMKIDSVRSSSPAMARSDDNRTNEMAYST